MPGHSIETYTGHYLDLVNPSAEDVLLEDIAVALSNICRYAGAVTKFYSVAEHAVRVSKLAQQEGADVLTQMLCLHHDDHEAYMGDITTPLKRVIRKEAPGILEDIASNLDSAIYESFGLPHPTREQQEVIDHCDITALYREAATLKYSHGRGDHWGRHEYVRPYAGIGWTPSKAEQTFLKRHATLAKKLARATAQL
jgi:hypothetical protein